MPFQPRLLMAPLSLAVRLLLPRRSAVAVMLVYAALPSRQYSRLADGVQLRGSGGAAGLQAAELHEDVLDYLENEPTIFRYAWFSGRTTAIAIVDLVAGAGALTTLGGDYVSLPEPAACFR